MDIQNPRLLKLKGLLFLLLALISASLVLCIAMDWRIAVLLAILAWSSARFYYFAFYVLHHYADREFRYAGLWDLIKYLWRSRNT